MARKDGKIIASMKKPTSDGHYFLFPLGTYPWEFKSEVDGPPSCHDVDCDVVDCDIRTGPFTRKMILHLVVKQPGYFCCNDGACIDSDYRFKI